MMSMSARATYGMDSSLSQELEQIFNPRTYHSPSSTPKSKKKLSSVTEDDSISNSETVNATVSSLLESDAKESTFSLQVFRAFIHEEDGRLDASRVFSSECYERWLASRRVYPANPEEAFRRVLTAHVRGSDGRKPFPPMEEEALLKELRIKRVWPCFINSSTTAKIGINGFRAIGFHEKRNTNQLYFSHDNDNQLVEYDVDQNHEDDEQVYIESVEVVAPDSNDHSQEKTEVTADDAANIDPDKPLSSFEVFMLFAAADCEGNSRILSRECFDAWVMTRRHGVKNAEHSFRKALIAHLCGKDGRRPFPPELEKLVVTELRKTRVWPCFEASDDPRVLNIGNKGFKPLAFHEAGSDGCWPSSRLSDREPTDSPKLEKKMSNLNLAKNTLLRKSSKRKLIIVDPNTLATSSTPESSRSNVNSPAHSQALDSESDFVSVASDSQYDYHALAFDMFPLTPTDIPDPSIPGSPLLDVASSPNGNSVYSALQIRPTPGLPYASSRLVMEQSRVSDGFVRQASYDGVFEDEVSVSSLGPKRRSLHRFSKSMPNMRRSLQEEQQPVADEREVSGLLDESQEGSSNHYNDVSNILSSHDVSVFQPIESYTGFQIGALPQQQSLLRNSFEDNNYWDDLGLDSIPQVDDEAGEYLNDMVQTTTDSFYQEFYPTPRQQPVMQMTSSFRGYEPYQGRATSAFSRMGSQVSFRETVEVNGVAMRPGSSVSSKSEESVSEVDFDQF